jgi:hypothetical protein
VVEDDEARAVIFDGPRGREVALSRHALRFALHSNVASIITKEPLTTIANTNSKNGVTFGIIKPESGPQFATTRQ